MTYKPCSCFYCQNQTKLQLKSIKKSINNKLYTINNVPIFYCEECEEIFYPDSVIKVFNKVDWKLLVSNIYDFEYLQRNIRKE
ncbi:MAG: YgiT-type zinc finger protein [Ignavibacteriales bacterium]